MSKILVTGGSGFVGAHCILQALAAGHEVRATVRDLGREAAVRAELVRAGAALDAPLSFVAANLTEDAGWDAAVTGCDHVLHVASPFPLAAPAHEDELIVPARDGALRVLAAARKAGVKRVVLTSSFAAIGYGHPHRDDAFDESDWTNVDGPGVTAYVKSKTVAERAAWDFIARDGSGLELAVINPVGILGPVLGPDLSSSIQIVKRLLDGGLPACPDIRLGVVDVRDVADLHLRAMTAPKAAGQRFLAVAGEPVSMQDVALILKRRLGAAARRVPTGKMPTWMIRLIAMFDADARGVLPQLGQIHRAANDKARRMLDWTPISNEDAVLATAESLLRLGLTKAAA